MAKYAQQSDIIQWLQKSYIEVPGTVFVTAQEMYGNYCSLRNVEVSKILFQCIVRKFFTNIKIIKNNAIIKYTGLRQNFIEDKPCTILEIEEIARKYGFFLMTTTNCGDYYKFGLSTGVFVNRNEILKIVEIKPDKTFTLSVGGREVNIQEIGLEGVTIETYFNIKILFNTFQKCSMCHGKPAKSKTEAKKFSVVQEWFKKGDENSVELRLTSRNCHGIICFTAKSTTCNSCSNQKTLETPPEVTESTEDIFKGLFPDANDLMLNFLRLQSQMSSDGTDKRSRRWNKEIIQVCLTLWNRSPQSYSSLRSSGMLILPSESLLSKYKNCLQQSPGINEQMFQWMFNESKNLNSEKSGGLIIDEMSVQEDLKMSFKNGKISVDGLVQMGNFAEDMNILNKQCHETRSATHVMQLIFLGFDGFRFPIAYYPTSGANAAELYDMVWSVINKLTEYEFYVDYVCFDGCSNNRAFQMLHFDDATDAKNKQFTVVNPSYPSQNVTFMMDYSHNIKKLRNNIHSSGNKSFSTRKLTKGDQVIVWDIWIDAYTWDKQYNTPIRVHQKLTDEHIFLNKTSKMRNHLAEQVLDKDMLNLMIKYKESLINGSHLNLTIELLTHTSKVIEIFRDRRPVTSIDDQRLADLLRFNAWLDEWYNSVVLNEELSATEKNKSFITRETYSDLGSMVHGFLSVCKRRIKKEKKSVTPAGVNSDIVENFFCMQRTINHGSNSNPTVHQYKYAINATVLGQNSVSKKSNACNKRRSCQPYNFTTPQPLNKKPSIRL